MLLFLLPPDSGKVKLTSNKKKFDALHKYFFSEFSGEKVTLGE